MLPPREGERETSKGFLDCKIGLKVAFQIDGRRARCTQEGGGPLPKRPIRGAEPLGVAQDPAQRVGVVALAPMEPLRPLVHRGGGARWQFINKTRRKK